MGMTEVRLKVKNPRTPSKVFEGKFLVDSGATYTVVPENILKKLGIKPEGKEDFSLADGRSIARKVGNALYEYEGIQRAAPVLFGEYGKVRIWDHDQVKTESKKDDAKMQLGLGF